MTKYHQVIELVEKRIEAGDYIARPFPHETVFSQEIGVSRITARKALGVLIEKGLLKKKPNGRIEVNHEQTPHDLNLAILAPAWESPLYSHINNQLAMVAEAYNAHVRNVVYVNLEDSVIPETIRGFDGTIVILSDRHASVDVFEPLRKEGNAFVVIGDLSQYSIPSMLMLPNNVSRLLDYLYRLGHRNIACLNSEPTSATTVARIEQWELWKRMHGVSGELYDCPVENYGCPYTQAYKTISALIESDKIEATAIFGVSGSAAIGAMRAFKDYSINAGEDISICAFDLPPGVGEHIIPRLTAFREPDYSPFLRAALEWIDKGGKDWKGSYLYQPQLELFEGESVCRCSEMMLRN